MCKPDVKRTNGSLADRFAGKYTVDPITGCWLWFASKDQKGYGKIRHGAVSLRAHRVSYELRFGKIPEGDGHHGTCVLHKCDNPSCVNPDHLFLGSNLENIIDMRQKDRDSKGESRYNAKLTERDIVAIKNDTRYQWQIAADYGINQSQVSRIKGAKRWAHTERKAA